MKKFAPIALIALFGALTFASCKKIYTCTCTTDINGTKTTASAKSPTKMSKKDAKAACEQGNQTGSTGGYTYTVTCAID